MVARSGPPLTASERADLAALNALVRRHAAAAEGAAPPGALLPLHRVRPGLVLPDTTNRERTGISLEHAHSIATAVAGEGFRRRAAFAAASGGHDTPVVVREAAVAPSGAGAESVARWREAVEASPGLPPLDELEAEGLLDGDEAQAVDRDGDTCFYTSLGNGHFFQALNLLRTRSASIFSGAPYAPPEADAALQDALSRGVTSVVLRADCPTSDRKKISLLLNRLHGIQWEVDGDAVRLDVARAATVSGSQFEAMSKNLDAEELSVLVRTKMGVDFDDAASGYQKTLNSGKHRSKL